MFKFYAYIGGLILFVLAGLTVMFGSWYTVDQTQRGVLLRNGAIIGVVQPGLNFKTPWIESVYKIDMQTHTKTYGQDAATGKDVMEAYSADQQPAFLRVSVTLHIAPDKVAEMYSRFGGDYDAAISRVISPHVYERVKVVFGQYTAAKAISSRGQLNADASASITQSIAYDPIFVIESAQIENISFSPDYIRSVEQRMQAEVEVQRQQQNYQQEKIKADIAVTQANGRANSVRAEAQAAADATVLRGNAEAAAIKAKADALSSNSNLITLTQAERWDGRLPTTMVPGSAVPFITVR
jgi:regulator of protease activity HflC (stomatin/prohibitin superfamily)